jgi:hypothetical protein
MMRWLVVAAFALVAYAAALAPADRRVRETQARASELYLLANRNEAALRDAPALRAAEWRVARDLSFLRRHGDDSGSIVSLLQLLRERAARFHVAVNGLSPSNRAGGQGVERLTLGLHGTYQNVVRTIASLSLGPVLLDVDNVLLSEAPDDFGLPGVDAAVDVVVYHNAAAVFAEPKENQRVSLAP